MTFFPTYFNIEKYTLCPGDTLFRHDVNLFETGLYNLVFQTVNGCDSLFLVEIEALDFPSEPIVEPDCDNYLYTLTVESEDDWSPFWSNGANSLTTIYPDSVNAFLDWTHDSLTCRVVYNFLLHPIPLSAPVFAFQDSIIYPGKPITLTLENPGELWSVDWSPGYLMSCDTCFINTITTTLPAEIGVILTHQTGCDFRYNFFLNVDPTLDIQIPNIFSPEADVPNNKWSWLVPDCFEVLTLKLYDRWGNLVFDREKPGTVDWEGYFNGMLVEQGVYTYITKYLRPDGSIQTKTGDVTMILLK